MCSVVNLLTFFVLLLYSDGNTFTDESHIQLFLDGEELLTEELEDIAMGLGVAMGGSISFLILSMEHH